MDDLTVGPDADELAALRDSVADLLATECDRRKLHDFVDGRHDLEALIWGRARELGWLAVGLPAEQGGMGLGLRGLAVLHRELGRQLAPGAFVSTLAAAQALSECGISAMAPFLTRVAEGDVAICVPATPMQDGGGGIHYANGKLSGNASELLGTPGAGFVLAPVTTGKDRAWALIEVDGKAAKLVSHALWDPTRRFCSLDCTGATPAGVIEGVAAAKLQEALSMHMALGLCFDSVGGADSILNQTIDYMKGRVQFDKVIASFQALKHRVARLKIEWELARYAALQALQAAEIGGPDSAAVVALSKATVGEAYAAIAGDCVQLHGGVGHTWDFDCHLFLKRARLNEALVGSNDSQLDWAAARFAEATQAGRSVLELPL